MIDSTRLRSFIAFAEELSFTRAAQRLHISQPALHVQITRLAEELGSPLYRRVGRTISLTSQGRDLLGFAREMSERTETFLRGLGGEGQETLVLAAGEGTLLYALGPAIRKAAQLPHTRLRVLTRDREGTLAALATAEAHLGVTTLDVVPKGFTATLLRQAAMLVVMPRGHRLARKRRVRMTDLDGERLVVPPGGRPHRELIARTLTSAGASWEVALEANGWEVMLQYAALGVGLAIVNDICRMPRGVVARPLVGLPALRYYVVHRARLGLSPAATTFRALIVEAFTRAPGG